MKPHFFSFDIWIFLTLYAFAGCTSGLRAQDTILDSHDIELEISEVDELIKKSVAHIEKREHRSADSLLAIAEEIHEIKDGLLVKIWQNKGASAEGQRNSELALSYFQKAKEIASSIDDGEKYMAAINLDIGGVYFHKGEILKSSEILFEAIGIFEESEDWSNVSVTYLNLAINNMAFENYEKSRSYGLEGLRFAQKADNVLYEAHSYLVLSSTISELGDQDEALRYALNGYQTWQQLENPYQVGMASRFVGKILKTKKNFLQALPYLQESVQKFKSISVDDQLLYSTIELAENTLLLGKKKTGLELLRDAEKIFQAYRNKRIIDNQNVVKLFESAYRLAGNWEEAYDYRVQHDLIKDSLFQKERMDGLAEIETEFQVKQKESALALKNSQLVRQKSFTIAACIIAGLLLLASFLAWRNIQQKKKINENLEKLDRAKSRFFANISHELRTPLTLIIGPLERALSNAKISVTNKKDISLALNNSNQLLSLVNEIMDLSKIESGKLELDLRKVNLYKLTNRIFSAFESLAEINKVHMTLDYDLDKNLTTSLDIAKYEKVLNNLISNAIKFTQSDGKVIVSVSQDTEGVIISVKDSGKGISSEYLEKIFDRFYQVSDDASYQGGTGIGLALAKELSTLHGGTLTVKSQKDNGSTFTMKLPLDLMEGNGAQDIITQETTSNKSEYEPIIALGERYELLVIEDHEAMREYLQELLSPYYKLTFAIDGQDGLDKVRLNKYDAITCDVMMPKMGGFEFLENLRKSEIQSHIPVIMLTARNLEEDKLRGLHLGTDDYITKPFNAKELLARLNNLIENKRSREEEKNQDIIEIESIDVQTLRKIESHVLKNISNDSYSVIELASEMKYSSRQLSRILKRLTGMNTNQFIREIRLQKAYQMISTKQYATISEVRYDVGIPHASYFTKEFEKRFGIKPGEVR